MPALLAEADACVAPLALNDRNVTQGCCPIKVLECMAAGRPLVAANLPVVRELAREDQDALLFAPNEPGETGGIVAGIFDEVHGADLLENDEDIESALRADGKGAPVDGRAPKAVSTAYFIRSVQILV